MGGVRVKGEFATRPAATADAGAIALIYNQGIEERNATFETSPRSAEDILKWLGTKYPVVVGETDGTVVSFAAAFQYRSRTCYEGVGEFSVYVSRQSRGRGIGTLTMVALIEEAKQRGLWKLISRVFPENEASRKMLGFLGFREVGTYEYHGKLDGIWKDTVIVEYIIRDNIR